MKDNLVLINKHKMLVEKYSDYSFDINSKNVIL